MPSLVAQLAASPAGRRLLRRALLVVVGLPLAAVCLLALSLLSEQDADADALAGVTCAPTGASPGQVGQWDEEQMGNAARIVSVGRQQQVPEQALVAALMAAMTESRLRNLSYGDRDSVGLFQMRPSQGWGSRAQLTDPVYAASKFYSVLLAVPNWLGMPPGNAAQAVERSAFPDRYATFEDDARHVLGALAGVSCDDWMRGSDRAERAVSAALSQLGVPYAWGGGTAQGPSPGIGADARVTGFDCSGLALYAYAQAGVAVPHQTQAIWAAFQPAITDPARVERGDLVLLSANSEPGGIHHVGIYLGDGRVVHAPESGGVVSVVDDIWRPGSYWARQFIGAVRPGT